MVDAAWPPSSCAGSGKRLRGVAAKLIAGQPIKVRLADLHAKGAQLLPVSTWSP